MGGYSPDRPKLSDNSVLGQEIKKQIVAYQIENAHRYLSGLAMLGFLDKDATTKEVLQQTAFFTATLYEEALLQEKDSDKEEWNIVEEILCCGGLKNLTVEQAAIFLDRASRRIPVLLYPDAERQEDYVLDPEGLVGLWALYSIIPEDDQGREIALLILERSDRALIWKRLYRDNRESLFKGIRPFQVDFQVDIE